MRESRKSQLASFVILMGIGLLSLLLLFAMNFLAWPVGSAIGKVATFTPSPQKVPFGVLSVTVVSNQTLITTSNLVNNTGISFPFSTTEPLTGIPIAVSKGTLQPFVTNRTDNVGQILENIPPDTYNLRLGDWRLNNMNISVQVYSNKVTAVNVTLNATSYTVQQFDIFDPDSTGFVVGWEQVYAQLLSSQLITAKGPQTFMDTNLAPATPIEGIGQSMVTPISIASVQLGNGSQWVQFQVKAPLNIGNIKAMSLLSLKTFYSVNTSAI
ncbi:MAG: hypothetical protein OK439_03630 [Thaumarchaeota archaeon]|nr:hypothetical protein [Nitrososphaerota archaeon]